MGLSAPCGLVAGPSVWTRASPWLLGVWFQAKRLIPVCQTSAWAAQVLADGTWPSGPLCLLLTNPGRLGFLCWFPPSCK